MFAHVFACLFYFLIGKVNSKEPLCCHEAELVKARSNCGDSLPTFHFTVCVGVGGGRPGWSGEVVQDLTVKLRVTN